MIILKLLPLAALEVFGASSIPDANLVLNLVMLVVLLFGAPRFFRSKNAEAIQAEKDKVIATHKQAIEAQDRRIADLDSELKVALGRNAKLSEVAAIVQGRYEEQSKYTAENALRVLQETLTKQDAEAERRHLETMKILGSLAEVLGERRESNLPPFDHQ